MPITTTRARRRFGARLLTLAALSVGALATASAQTWPTQTVKILVGFPGGSTPDMAARALAEALAQARWASRSSSRTSPARPATSPPIRWPRPPTTTRWASSSTAT